MRRLPLVLGAFLVWGASATSAAAQEEWPQPREGCADTRLETEALRQGGTRFTVGMRVQLARRANALPPELSGHSASLGFGPGQRGTVLGFVRRHCENAAGVFDFSIIMVRWDAQSWYEWDIPLNRIRDGVAYSAEDLNRMNRESGAEVRLASFLAPVHGENLQPEMRRRRRPRE